MKTLTKITLSLLALAALGAAPIVRAQNADTAKSERRGAGGPGAGMGEDRLQAMAERLGLTAEQKSKLQAVAKTQREAMAKLRDDDSLTREARREKMQAMRTTQQAEIRAILTAEQAGKWETAMAEGGRRGAPGGAGGSEGREGRGRDAKNGR